MGAADEVEVVLVQELLRRRIGRGKHLRTETRETRHNHTRTRIGRGGDLRDGGAEIRHGDSRSGAEIRDTEICRLGAEIRETEIRDRAPRSDPAVRRHAEMRDAPARGHGRGEDRGGRHTPARNSVETGASFTRSSIPRAPYLSSRTGRTTPPRNNIATRAFLHGIRVRRSSSSCAPCAKRRGATGAAAQERRNTRRRRTRTPSPGGAEQGPFRKAAPSKGLVHKGAPARGAARRPAEARVAPRTETAARDGCWDPPARGDGPVPRHGARTATAAPACGHSLRVRRRPPHGKRGDPSLVATPYTHIRTPHTLKPPHTHIQTVPSPRPPPAVIQPPSRHAPTSCDASVNSRGGSLAGP